jgi:hypothetical protein
MRITFTITTTSTDVGPFNISGTTSSNVTYWIATGVTRTQLTNGHPVDTEYETITGGTIASTGNCTDTKPWSVTPNPTPTPIPPTPTVVSYLYNITPDSRTTISDACSYFTTALPSEVWAAEQTRTSVTRFFTDSSLTSGLSGGGYYSWKRDVDSESQRVSGEIASASGYITSAIEAC